MKVLIIPNVLTHYSPVLLFNTPWKHQKTFRFSDVFRGYRKVTPGCNGLKAKLSTLLRVWLKNEWKNCQFQGKLLLWTSDGRIHSLDDNKKSNYFKNKLSQWTQPRNRKNYTRLVLWFRSFSVMFYLFVCTIFDTRSQISGNASLIRKIVIQVRLIFLNQKIFFLLLFPSIEMISITDNSSFIC